MLELNDPLWNKLDDAHGVGGVPAKLSRLAASWDEEASEELLCDTLLHQGTCYGATYATIPHLLKIAEPKKNRRQRLEIAVFCAQVALESRDRRQEPGRRSNTLQGLPETLEGWDRKRDCYRELVAIREQPHPSGFPYDMTDLPRWRAILAIEPVSAGDLKKILAIKADFFSALPAIRTLCERTLLENLEEPAHMPYLLTGIAAADGLLDVARLLDYGDEGSFRCLSCGWPYDFMRFGERIAVYAEDAAWIGRVRELGGPDDKRFSDYKDGAPSRADGFMTPITEDGVLDARVAALLALAKRGPSAEPALLLRQFAGNFVCCKCGVQGPMHPL